MSPFYTVFLILNPSHRTRYLKTYWLKKWSKPALTAVKKLWERYRKKVIFLQTYPAFSYDNPLKSKKFDTFNQIALSLRSITRPTSKNEYKNYNSQNSHFPRAKETFA
jgi:hypothetical protein